MRLDVAEDAPGGELLARQKLQFGGATDIRHLLVHPPDPEGKPAKTAFEDAQPKAPIAVENAAGKKAGHKAHGAPEVRAHARQIDIVPHVLAARLICRRPG